MTTTTYFTFGIQYHRGDPETAHPLAPWADCDGYLTVVAPDHEIARRAVMQLLGRQWAFDYVTPPKAQHAPLGELARLVITQHTELTVAAWKPDHIAAETYPRDPGLVSLATALTPAAPTPGQVDLVAALRGAVEAAKVRRAQDAEGVR